MIQAARDDYTKIAESLRRYEKEIEESKRDLAGFEQILKQPSDLLADAFRAYAAGQATPSYLMPPDQRRIIVSSLHRVAQGDPKLDRVISESQEQVKLMTKVFRQWMTESRAEVLAQWEMIVAKQGRNPSWATAGDNHESGS